MAEVAASCNTVAGLTNVGLCHAAMTRAVERKDHLPGMISFYGPSGWGKSTAAAYTMNKWRAYYVECKSTWTRKALLLACCKAMGLSPTSTLYDLTSQVAEQLYLSSRPLIIDDFHLLVRKGGADLARDLYKESNAAIMLIGEECLPDLLAKHEQVHNRQLDWVAAQPATRQDAIQLAKLYSPTIEIADDLMGRVHELSRGSIERICVNVERISREVGSLGQTSIDLKSWGKRDLFTGDATRRF